MKSKQFYKNRKIISSMIIIVILMLIVIYYSKVNHNLKCTECQMVDSQLIKIKSPNKSRIFVNQNHDLCTTAVMAEGSFTAIIDTGSRFTLINGVGNAKVKLSGSKHTIMDLSDRKIEASWGELDSVRFGDINILKMPVLVNSLSQSTDKNHGKVFLGNSIFSKGQLILDLRTNSMQYRPISSTISNSISWIPFHSSNDSRCGVPDSIIVTGDLFGKKVNISIDTGCEFGIIVSRRVINESHGLSIKFNSFIGGYTGFIANQPITCKIGAIKLSAKPLIISELATNIDIIIGIPSLEGRILIIDYPNQRLALE